MVGDDFSGIDGIILDAVGTIIEPVPSVSQVYRDAALRQGVELDLATVRSRFRAQFAADETDETFATSEEIERKRWQRIVAGCLPELPDPAHAFEELWDHFGNPDSWHVFEDVPATLTALRGEGKKICIASNFDGRLRKIVQALLDFSGEREPLVISSEVGHRKPHADFYISACQRLNLPYDRVLCVGDDPMNDVEGPSRVGIRALLIDRTASGTTRSDSIESLSELVGLLVDSNSRR